MAEYEVLAGHKNAEFRQHEDGSIELYSMESRHGEDEEIGTVGTLTEAEMVELGDTLDTLVNDPEVEEVPPPELENIVVGQMPGAILLVAKEDGEPNEDLGAAFGNPEVIISAATEVSASA